MTSDTAAWMSRFEVEERFGAAAAGASSSEAAADSVTRGV
jgi:hypothetical protein